MKQRSRIAMRVSGMLSLIIGILFLLGHFLRPVNCDAAIKAIETFHDMPENSIEVIGYGSSRMWRGLNVVEMYEEYGIGAYNYGCNWQKFNTTLLFLQDSFRTQSPKVVLIEVFQVNNLKKDSNVDGEIYYTRYIPESKEKQEYLRQCFNGNIERYISYYIPMYAFHENWKNLEQASFMKNSSAFDFYKTKGFSARKKITEVTIPDFDTFEQEVIGEESLAILDQMVALCKEKGAEIIFYTAPSEQEYEYSDAMAEYAEEHGCVYIDTFEKADEIGFDTSVDFADSSHLNTNGATKLANYLGVYIVENYDVTDMRTIENNIWESAS